MTRGLLSNFIWTVHPLLLAVIIDIIKIIPFVDVFITIWFQYVLWTRLENTPLMWLNISYDLTFDGLIFFPFGDIIPTNTISTIAVLLYNDNEKINI